MASSSDASRKIPWDVIVHAGVRLAAGGAGRLLWSSLCTLLRAVCRSIVLHTGHGHSLHLLHVAFVLAWRGLRSTITVMRPHMCPLSVLHLIAKLHVLQFASSHTGRGSCKWPLCRPAEGSGTPVAVVLYHMRSLPSKYA